MKIIKNQEGGIIPLLFTPLQQLTASQPSTTVTKSSTTEEKEDLLSADVIKSLAEHALPSDMQSFLNQSIIFNNSLFNSSLINPVHAEEKTKMLLTYMNKMNFEKSAYDNAMTHIIDIDATDEIAVTTNNKVFVIRDKKLVEVGVNKLKASEQPLTNGQIAKIRSENPGAAFDTEMTTALSNATSMKEIEKVMSNALTNLGETKENSEMLSKIKASEDISLSDMQKMGYNELVKYKISTSSNLIQIHNAVQSIYKQLTPSQRTLLKYKAKELNVKDELTLILEFIISKEKGESSITMDTSAKETGGNPLSKIKYNETLQLMIGMGYNTPIQIHEGTRSQIEAIGTHSIISNKSGEPLGQTSATNIQTSSLSASLDMNNMTLGGQKINTHGLNYIMLRDSNVKGVDLPIMIKSDGTITPDFGLISKVQDVETIIKEKQITDINEINKLYKEHNLPVKYTGTFDEYGLPILVSNNYRRFVGMNVTADEKAFSTSPENNNRLKLLDDNSPYLKTFQNVMRKTGSDKDFKYTDPWGFWNDPKVWDGILWIPLKMNAIQAYLGNNSDLTVSQALYLNDQEQGKQVLKNAQTNYNSADQIYNNVYGN